MPLPSHPRVTVLIPAFQAHGFVLGAIDSVLGQTYPHVEVLVIPDDADTYQFVRDKRSSIQLSILAPTDRNLGPGLSRNRGIDRATGEYLAVCDADDRWAPNYLECLMPLAVKHGATVAPTRYVSEQGSVTRHPPFPPGLLTVSGFGQLLASAHPVVHRSLEVAYFDVFAEDVLHDMHVIAAMGGAIPVCADTYYEARIRQGSLCDANDNQEQKIQKAYQELTRAIRYHPTMLSLQRLTHADRMAMAQAFEFRRYASELFTRSGQSCYNRFVAGREAQMWDDFQVKSWDQEPPPLLLGRAVPSS